MAKKTRKALTVFRLLEFLEQTHKAHLRQAGIIRTMIHQLRASANHQRKEKKDAA